jgi:hypothetical protein
VVKSVVKSLKAFSEESQCGEKCGEKSQSIESKEASVVKSVVKSLKALSQKKPVW